MTTTERRPRRARESMSRQVALSGIWAVVGFIGVSVLASQFIGMGQGAAIDESLGLALVGGAMALYAWGRTKAALRSAGAPSAGTPTAVWEADGVAQAAIAPHR